jgi:hypothetical protein
MANDRIAALEAKFEARSEARDAQLADLNESFATILEKLRAIETGISAVSTRVEYLERRPTPGLLQYWVPVLSTAIALGALGTAFLGTVDQKVDRNVILLEHLEDLSEKQAQDQSYIKGRQDEIAKHLEDVDVYGSRRWNAEHLK